MVKLFKPPHFHILKRIPHNARFEAIGIESFVDSQSYGMSQVKTNFAKAFVLSVWANNSVAAGKFSLSISDINYIRNAGMNCFNRLDFIESGQAESMLDKLIETGLVPAPNK